MKPSFYCREYKPGWYHIYNSKTNERLWTDDGGCGTDHPAVYSETEVDNALEWLNNREETEGDE